MIKWTGTTPDDWEFTRVGITPVTFQLPTGSYLLEAEGPDVTRGSRMLEMRGAPRRLVIDTGSEGLGTAGTLMMGVGSLAILAGVVMLAGGKTSEETGFDKTATAIPLLASGAGLLGGGITFYVLSRTSVEDQRASGLEPRPATKQSGFMAGLRFRL